MEAERAWEDRHDQLRTEMNANTSEGLRVRRTLEARLLASEPAEKANDAEVLKNQVKPMWGRMCLIGIMMGMPRHCTTPLLSA